MSYHHKNKQGIKLPYKFLKFLTDILNKNIGFDY